MEPNLFSKFQDLTFKPTGTLFGIDLRDATDKGLCPYCGNKLYLMRNKPMYFCKGIKHANRFIISADKVRFRR